MLSKGIIFLLIWLLFLSRLIPKTIEFREKNQVHLFGHIWEGPLGMIVRISIAVIAIILLAMSIRNFYEYFTAGKDSN